MNKNVFIKLFLTVSVFGSLSITLPINRSDARQNEKNVDTQKTKQVLRIVKCAFRPKKNNCSINEVKQARAWVGKMSAGTVAAIAAAVGISIAAKQIYKETKPAYMHTHGTKLNFKADLKNPYGSSIDSESSFYITLSKDGLNNLATKNTLGHGKILQWYTENILKSEKNYAKKLNGELSLVFHYRINEKTVKPDNLPGAIIKKNGIVTRLSHHDIEVKEKQRNTQYLAEEKLNNLILITEDNIKIALKLPLNKNYFAWNEILGLKISASPNEISTKYKKLARLYHPDKNIDNQSFAEKIIKLINEAKAKADIAQGV